MKETQKLHEITAEITDQINFLKYMVDQVSSFGDHISKITDYLAKYNRDLKVLDKITFDQPAMRPAVIQFKQEKSPCNVTAFTSIGPNCFLDTGIKARSVSNIIPFPGRNWCATHSSASETANSAGKQLVAAPGTPLPAGVVDFRPQLQRDGLILLAWDRRITEKGERLIAYWVTSVGIPRFYASKQLSCDDFPSAVPDHKSYAAEDGIEFFGQKAPLCLVHVAPELMMSNPRHSELRQAHIKMLLLQGNKVDYNYKYLLTKEKKRNLPLKRSRDQSPGLAGA